MRHCVWLLGLLSLFSLATHASDWQEIKNDAKGQTVWFNAWGGDTAINRYLDWVSGEMKTHYAINLKIVRLADAADAVKRIQTEAAAGRKTGGSVDLLWVNGENFRTLKEANLLQTGWAETLQLALRRYATAGTGRFFCTCRRCRISVGWRTTDVYRPPRCYATATTNAASIAGVCQSQSRHGYLSAPTRLHRHGVSGTVADYADARPRRIKSSAERCDFRPDHCALVAIS